MNTQRTVLHFKFALAFHLPYQRYFKLICTPNLSTLCGLETVNASGQHVIRSYWFVIFYSEMLAD